MNLRLQMLQVARLAPRLLGESAGLVQNFLVRQQNSDGGFKDREGKSDLYYTVFALDGLMALQAELPANSVARYLQQFGDGEGLDFVHLCCLARCWGTLTHATKLACPPDIRESLVKRILAFRSTDGGFGISRRDRSGSVYAAFLATGALQDLGACIPESLQLVQSFKRLECDDGGWSNDIHAKTGGTNPTAAAVVLLHSLSIPLNQSVGEWLMGRVHPQGGFAASAETPVPDLLSTATALHALTCLDVNVAPIREKCLDFVDSLWTNEGGFYGHWSDEHIDCEYTYYGLLALGNLSAD